MRATSIAAAVLVFAAAASAGGPQFVDRVDNPWFPLTPGTTFVYTGLKDGKPARDVVTVTSRTKTILGAHATVVDDRLYLAGRLAERTSDWYAQDASGNVWYMGEATAELDRNGRVTTREGSWQAGVRGARPGIFMPAHPRVGQSFLQEYSKGEAEDRFRIVSMTAPVRVPYAASRRALVTREWTRLEPGVIGRKYYIRGIGLVKEQSISGEQERTGLVSVTRG
jgi:hypothetical protein